MTLPSVKQMANRANTGHRKALRSLAESRPVLGPTASAGDIRGMRTVLDTLLKWECRDGDQLTDRGRDLLAHLDETWSR